MLKTISFLFFFSNKMLILEMGKKYYEDIKRLNYTKILLLLSFQFRVRTYYANNNNNNNSNTIAMR